MALTKVSSDMKTAPTSAEVSAHVTGFDDSSVRNDIATLALHSAIADNKAAYNLSNSFIDQFESDAGLDVQTDTDRNADEYMGSVSGTGGLDAYTKLLLHMDGSDGGTTITDSSARGATTYLTGNVHTDTTIKKFGTSSLQFDGSGDYTHTGHTGDGAVGHNDYNLPATEDWTLDYWVYDQSPHDPTWGRHLGQAQDGSYDGWHVGYSGSTQKVVFGHDSSTTLFTATNALSVNTWYHICIEHDDSADTVKFWINGVLDTTVTGAGSDANYDWHNEPKAFQMGRTNPNGGDLEGYLDEVRISKGICRTQDPIDPLYISSGTGFTPPTSPYEAQTVNATGSFTSVNQTATAAVDSMGIVVLYKDAYGTASLNSDLVCEISANGGTNYSSATLVAGGTFSSGINIAAVSGVSVTAGTAPKYKISFANQASVSKETQVHGVALLY